MWFDMLTIKPEGDLLALGLNAAAWLDLVGLVAAGVAQGRHDDDLFEERNVGHLNKEKIVYTNIRFLCFESAIVPPNMGIRIKILYSQEDSGKKTNKFALNFIK